MLEFYVIDVFALSR